MTDTLGSTGSDALAVIQQVLAQYGLQNLSQWAINEIQVGASADQITQDMTTTPQFQARFPAIALRQQAGLPAISPAEYVSYENTLAQMESQFGVPKGTLTDQNVVTQFIAGDTSPAEVQSRVQQGFDAVAYAPPTVRDEYANYFGVSGDAALASHFLDPKNAMPRLLQEASAAQIGGVAGMGGISIGRNDALALSQLGKTGSDMTAAVADLNQKAPLFDNSVTEGSNLAAGTQGIEAEFGLNSTATQEVINRQQAREASFAGGGTAYGDQHGLEGAGSAKSI